MMTTARDNTRRELLTSGLADWVHLGEIHYQVQQDNPDFNVEQVQQETLHTIQSLVSDGLAEVGDLSGPDGTFVAWNMPVEDSLRRITAGYVDEFRDETKWLWVYWLSLTDEGKRRAQDAQ